MYPDSMGFADPGPYPVHPARGIPMERQKHFYHFEICSKNRHFFMDYLHIHKPREITKFVNC